MDIRKELDDLKDMNYTRGEAISFLTEHGFDIKTIEEEIGAFYPKIGRKDIMLSFSFLFSFSIISLVTLAPFVISFIRFSVILIVVFGVGLTFAYGYYKLNKVAIIFWLIFFGLAIIYVIIGMLYTHSIGGYSSLIIFIALVMSQIANVLKKTKGLFDKE